MLRIPIFLLLSFVGLTNACSWDNCPHYPDDPNIINVHVIAHSHSDMGWLKTVDDYYTGRTKSIVNVGVEYVYNTVITELAKDPAKRFSFAETGFLTRWLEGRPANDSQVELMKRLVRDGQIEFVGGGWTQNDEGAAHYKDIIGQYAFGVKKLDDSFGKCAPPKIAWQIDPFGHSREHANIAAVAGFEGLVHGRMHYEDLKKRIADKELDYVWDTSDDNKMELPTTAFFANLYDPPRNFCFDIRCLDDPVVDDAKLQGYNLPEKRDEFIALVKEMSKAQRHNHVLVTLGGDFQYSDANLVFTSNDRLVKGVNAITNQTRIRIFYSTPSCYMTTLKGIRNELPRKRDDHFPYASKEHAYWSGYFTSKPELKRMVRQMSNLMQVTKAFRALNNLSSSEFAASEEKAERALGLAQHHDAITGTSKENVTIDYERRMREAASGVERILSAASHRNVQTKNPLRLCPQLGTHKCALLEAGQEAALISVFNGNSRRSRRLINVPLHALADLYDSNFERVDAEVSKTFVVRNDSRDAASYRLTFESDLPAFGFKTYLVRRASSKSQRRHLLKPKPIISPDIRISRAPPVLENEWIKLEFDEQGLPEKWTVKSIGRTFAFRQAYHFYFGVGGRKDEQSSGAYIFRPNSTEPESFGKPMRVEFVRGKNFQEVRQFFNSWVSQTVRLEKNNDFVEFQFTIGPIPKEEREPVAKEVITRFNVSEIQSAGLFRTDSNGRQMMERRIDFSSTYERNRTEPIASNFYPVASTILIQDSEHQLAVVTDRAQGGASFGNGNIDLMVHRRCFHDDGYGVDEPLDEPGADGKGLVVSGSHYVGINRVGPDYRRKAEDVYNEPIVLFAHVNKSEVLEFDQLPTFNGLQNPLPEQVNILTLQLLSTETILLRLENFYARKEGKGSAHVDLTSLFTGMEVLEVREMSLLGDKRLTDILLEDASRIELKPMQIRTFELTIRRF